MVSDGLTLRLEVGQFSHPGRKRTNNEDWLGTFQPEDAGRLAHKGRLFLVADGMGGHQSGEMASRFAADQVIRNYIDDSDGNVVHALRRAVEMANATLYSRAGSEETIRRRGTTLVAAVVKQGELWIANVGDSRAYMIRDRRMRQLSRDHSLSASELGIEPGSDWIGRHMITRALGLKPEVEVDVFPPVKMRVGDQVLLCSDGLTTPLSDDKIQDIAEAHPPQEAAEALVKAANEGGGPDNVSVIVVRVMGVSSDSARQSPGHFLATLFQPETWHDVIADLRLVAAGEQRWRSPLFLAAVLLICTVLLCLGFSLGMLMFGIL
ncbi:PP2C family protein-serine/threonine phosphatase [Chloroflexota bacterium]